jgi:tetratricopeptide (TPR) repeat protein
MNDSPESIPPEAVREELARVLASDAFSASRRLQRFLSFVVELVLEGKAGEIKEYALGVEVFDRGTQFDPRTDTIVRVEARRLRHQLAAYYDGPGQDDAVRIELPKRGYVPALRRAGQPVPANPTLPRQVRFRGLGYVLAGIAALALGSLAYFLQAAWNGHSRAVKPGATSNSMAQRRYWEGRYLRNQRTPEALEKSVQAFEQAVAADPGYAPAYAGLASSCATLGFQGLAADGLAIPRARQAAQKAIQLEDTNSEAHGVLGWIQFFYDRDWPSAETHLRRATELDATYAAAHVWYAFGLVTRGRVEEALRHCRTAMDLDSSLAATTDLSMILYYSGRYQEAAGETLRVVRLRPDFTLARVVLGSCCAALGRHQQAIAEYEKARGPSDRFSTVLGRLGLSYAVCNRKADALELFGRLQEAAQRGAKAHVEMALIHTGLGQKAQAMDALERAFEAHESDLLFLRVEPLLQPLRGEPRFQALCARLGLPH